jgi:hypothetical protein
MWETIKKFIKDNLTGIDNSTYYIMKSSLVGCLSTVVLIALHQEFFGSGANLSVVASSIGIIIGSHGTVIGLTPHTEPPKE